MRMNELQLVALCEKALADNGPRGYLFKRTTDGGKWQMRYFVLFQNLFFYFENENSSKPSGLIFLEGSYCDKLVQPGTGKHANVSNNLQHYFTITYRKEGSKIYELRAESESECNAWVHAIEIASFSKILLQKEELEQKHLHLVQIVESEKTAKWQYTQQCEELTMEIKKLRAELCALKKEWRLTPSHKTNNFHVCEDDSEEIRKIKKVQSFFRGWLCRRRWKQIVTEYISSPHAENMRKRNSLVFRMVEAEEEYLEQLHLMVSCFLRPFKMAASSQKPPCTHDEVNAIFLNAETVMFLHQIFLKGLTARMECWPTLVLGDLFDMLLPMLSIYQEYVRNHHFSLQVLAECKQRDKFASMLRRLEEKPATQGRTLETFLTYPMHQVPRYIITLHELLAHTPHNHVERKSLENARMKLEELSRQMHDEVSETENIRNNLAIERIIVGGCDILLDVNQVFIRKGSVLQVLTTDKPKSARSRLGSFRGDKESVRQCYLFSNHMLLCTRNSGGKLSLVDGIGKISLAESTLIEDPNEQFQFTVDDGDGSLSSASSHSSEATTQITVPVNVNGSGNQTPSHSGKDYGGLDFKIIVDSKTGPPMTIHLVAPTLQEKTAWISDVSQCIDNVHFNDLFHGTMNDSSSITMPHSIRNDPRLFKDDVDIRFSRTLNSCKLPQIRYASPDRLFERLTDLRFLSIDFLNTFLLTYRVFTDSITVIEALKRVHYNPEVPLSSSLQDSSGSLEETGGGAQGGAGAGQHLHPQQTPQHHGNLLNVHGTASGIRHESLTAGSVEFNTIEYDYTRRVSTSSMLSDINELQRETSTDSRTDREQSRTDSSQIFTPSSPVIRNSQHWRLSHRKFEEEQARDRYLKRMGNRITHGSICSTTSSVSGVAEVNFSLPAGEPMLAPVITEHISVPVPPPPSPEIPGYVQKCKQQQDEEQRRQASSEDESCRADENNKAPTSSSLAASTHQDYTHIDSCESSADDVSPSTEQPRTQIRRESNLTVGENLHVPVHSQSCDTITSEQSFPASPISSSGITSAGTMSMDSASKVEMTKIAQITSNGSCARETLIHDTEDVKKKQSTQSANGQLQSQLSEGTPPPTPPLPSSPRHKTSSQSAHQVPVISTVGGLFSPTAQPKHSLTSHSSGKADSRSSSISAPTPASGRLSATSVTLSMNYLRVRGAGSKRGSGSSECDSAPGSSSVTPRSSFQTDTTGISTPRSSFQHPDSPQMSSKAGVIVSASRATSRRSSTASAASAFAVATAASSNPPEPMDFRIGVQPMMARNKFSTSSAPDIKGQKEQAQNQAIQAQNIAACAARAKRESMISTAATMRVLNVLRHWISKHSQDFENDLRLLQITTDFLDELVHNTSLLPAEHKAAVQLQQMIAKQTMEAKDKIDLDILLAPPLQASKDTIETLSALEIAEVMTYIDHNIFVRIQSEEFLGQRWMKDDKSTRAFHILLMTKRFNDISRLVTSEVLRVPEIPKRVTVIEKWAAVADICRCLHNFNGVLQICAAFTNSSVYRLKRTWEKVTKTTKQTIEKLQTLVSTDGRFRNMREALHRCDPPCIPYLGMYLTDLSFIEEGTPNFTDDGLLNFSKMRMIAHVIREIRHFQQTPYKIEHNARVTNYLLDTSRHLSDEELYQMSLCLEPRLSRLGTKMTSSPVNVTSPSDSRNIKD